MIVLRFSPNGEFSQGVDTSHRRRPAPRIEKPFTKPLNTEDKNAYMRWIAQQSTACRHLYTPGCKFINRFNETYTYIKKDFDGYWWDWECMDGHTYRVLMNEPIGRLIARFELTPLVYQSLESSIAPKPSRKKLESMTRPMARNIRNGVYLLEKDYGKDNLSFLTLTLPALAPDEFLKIAANWDKMVDAFLGALRKQFAKKGMKFSYVYCTEIQTKRFSLKKEYAPHLHVVFRGRAKKREAWIITPQKTRVTWRSIIANVIGHVNFDTRALENLQKIKYSAARYLSKYMSKGNSLPEHHACKSALHTQWGGMSRDVCKRIQVCTVKLRQDGSPNNLCINILRCMQGLIDANIVKYFKIGYISLRKVAGDAQENFLKVGTGCLQEPTYTTGLTRLLSYMAQVCPE